jgi:hypothetical protein
VQATANTDTPKKKSKPVQKQAENQQNSKTAKQQNGKTVKQ